MIFECSCASPSPAYCVRDEGRGFTLVELCAGMSAAAVLAAAAAAVLFHCFAGPLFICEKALRAGALSEAMEAAVEGDREIPGLRSCSGLVEGTGSLVAFDTGDGHRITLRYDAAAGKIYRDVSGEGTGALPYYAAEEDIRFLPPEDGAVFTFYDKKDKQVHSLSQASRVAVSLCVAGGLDGGTDCVSTSVTLR